MGRAYLVTATDTEVGKTYFASLLLSGLRERGFRAFGFKPVETGCREERGRLIPSDGSVYHSFASGEGFSIEDVCPYRFRRPVSPNVAARESGSPPDVMEILNRIERWKQISDVLLVEGAGGILVEIVDGYTFADLAKEASFPVILVAPNRLGVLNHVALNVRFMELSGIELAGIVLNDVAYEASPASERNPGELRRLYGDLFLGHIAHGQKYLPPEMVDRVLGLES